MITKIIMVYIGWCKVVTSLVQVLFDLGLAMFYTYAFIVLPDEIKLQNMSIWFGIYIVLSWIYSIPKIKELYNIIVYFGLDIPEHIWDQICNVSKYYNFCRIINVMIGLYVLIQIGPFFKSCGIYTKDALLSCYSVRIIAFRMFIELCLLGLIIIFAGILVCIMMVLKRRRIAHSNMEQASKNNEIQNQMLNNPILVSATKFLEKYNPITEIDQNIYCPICFESAEDNDKEWTKLDCHHKAHRACLAQLYQFKQCCPVCNEPIIVNIDPV
jgi:hypothetical protein